MIDIILDNTNPEGLPSDVFATKNNHSHSESFNLLNEPTQSVGVGSLDSSVLD